MFQPGFLTHRDAATHVTEISAINMSGFVPKADIRASSTEAVAPAS